MPSRPATVCHSRTPTAPDWSALLAAFPGGARAIATAARSQGAWTRRRQLQSPTDLLRLVLAYTLTGWSLRFTAAWAEVVGLGHLSEAALRRRFRRLQPWLAQLVATCLLDVPALPVPGAVRLRVVDATTVCALGAHQTRWRVHLGLTVAPHLAVDALEVTDEHGGESLRRFPCASGELVLADRGYCHPTALAQVSAQGATWVVRYAWQVCPLRTAEGQLLDLPTWLGTVPPGGCAEQAVTLASRAAPALPGLRLVAAALPAEAAARARARLRRIGQRKRRPPSAQSQRVAGYVVLLTTLPAATWEAAAVLELYRVRWQVELTFKRLKGQWLLGVLRARTPALSQVTLLSRLLGALLAERLACPGGRPRVDWAASTEQPLSEWRWGQLWHQVVQQAVAGRLGLGAVVRTLPALHRHVCENPRRRQQQAAAVRAQWRALPQAPPLLLATA